MYKPETCPVCGDEYTEATEFDRSASAHSGRLDSWFCLLGSETDILVYIHEGNISKV